MRSVCRLHYSLIAVCRGSGANLYLSPSLSHSLASHESHSIIATVRSTAEVSVSISLSPWPSCMALPRAELKTAQDGANLRAESVAETREQVFEFSASFAHQRSGRSRRLIGRLLWLGSLKEYVRLRTRRRRKKGKQRPRTSGTSLEEIGQRASEREKSKQQTVCV